jgi:thiol-disulfide isomerase/thioredoxin
MVNFYAKFVITIIKISTMKKFYLITIVLIFSSTIGNAQSTLFFDDFESYTAGLKFVQQAPGTDWTTMNNTPGNYEDPIISNEYAHSGVNSVKIIYNKDLILQLYDKTTGRYMIKALARVTPERTGNFCILQDFDSYNSIYGLEIFFFENATGTVNAGGTNSADFTYTMGIWVPIKVIIDIDDDFATLYIDDNEVVSWIWSTGSAGCNTLAKLDALNFYGKGSATGQAETYYDDIEIISQLPITNGPSNLTSTEYDSGIFLSWDEPSSGTPDHYSILRNGVVINSGITTTNYSDGNLYPNTYEYEVKAHYEGLGYSTSSNTVTNIIGGGVERTKVLYEIGTGTWCVYCPSAAIGADEMVSNGHDVSVIEYHLNDNYENIVSLERLEFYNVWGYPTCEIDGVYAIVGGSPTNSLYPYYLTIYNIRKPVPSVHIMDLMLEHISGDDYQATITIEQTNGFFTSDLYLQTALTESHIPVIWINGMTEVNFVCRNMFPDASGSPLNFSASNKLSFTFDFSTAGYIVENLEFVAFVQHNQSKEVVQTVSKRLLYTELKNDEKLALTAYPNPTLDFINLQVNSQKQISYMITDVLGKIMVPMTKVASETTRIDVSSWNSGVYIIKTNDGYSRKFTIAGR